MKKLIQSLVITLVCTGGLAAVAAAQNYTIDIYDFRWEVARVGKTALFVQKTQDGVWALLTSPGGRIGSVRFTPAQAKSVGDMLLKAEEYYAEFKEKTMESAKSVPAGEVYVTFSSKRKGDKFKVSAHPERIIKNAVSFNKVEALEMGKLLQDIEARAAYAEKRVQP